MDMYYVLEGLQVKVAPDQVLKMINCQKDNPVYDEILEEYHEIVQEMISVAQPVGILGFGELPESAQTDKYKKGTPVIYAVLSVGDKIAKCSAKAFQEGDYVRGMLCDAIADCALFSLEDKMEEKLKEVCAQHGVGIAKRLEAPHDIPMEIQRIAWEHLELQKRFGIKISTGYMYDPVKTSCQVFVLDENPELFRAQHDCRKCTNFGCAMRKIPPVTVRMIKPDESFEVTVNNGESLMEALVREGHYVNAVCGGRGRCGKCRVKIKSGTEYISAEDRTVFREEELADGWRLACTLYPEEELEVFAGLNDESKFDIVSAHTGKEAAVPGRPGVQQKYDIAVDIGTTTIAFELFDSGNGKSVNTVTRINAQRKYGADVISRIQASASGKKEELRECICEDLRAGIFQLIKENNAQKSDIGRIIISGNTTMGHLLMGFDCSTLGVYPFEPVDIGFIKGTFAEVTGRRRTAEACRSISDDTQVVLLPGISTYVGGDILSGMYACGFHETEEICLLVDLGTNGEMALGNKDRILVTSTAAGPAFEGGNITWGTGSIAGAICSMKLEGDSVQIKTICDEKPVGVCGTGVIEAVAELVKEELVDESGLLDEDFFEDGFPLAKTADGREIVITQKDVREIQLAKAAVRAGVETLLLRFGITKDKVAKIYLAGGFGYKLNAQKAIAIGMLPNEFAGRIEAVGNSSLAGAVRYLQEGCPEKTLQQIVSRSEEIGLSADKDFNEFYMEAMFF